MKKNLIENQIRWGFLFKISTFAQRFFHLESCKIHSPLKRL